MSILGNLFSGRRGENYDKEGNLGYMGERPPIRWELTKLIENFLLRILIGITVIPMTGKIGDLRNLLIKGIRESVPQSQNIAKAFDVQQSKDEEPADFLHRLIDQMRKYSGLNIDDPLGQGRLKLHFVTNS
jgi:hypothetical protein